jgi:hypothetical protein
MGEISVQIVLVKKNRAKGQPKKESIVCLEWKMVLLEAVRA